MQKILSRIIVIGFGIQIVLGVLWMCNAFARAMSLGEGIVCVGATLLAGTACVFLKRSIRSGAKLWEDAFVAAALLTFPFVMQSLVYADRHIVMMSLLMFVTGAVLRIIRSCKGWKVLLLTLCFWLVSGGIVVGAEQFGKEPIPLSVRITERISWTTMFETYYKVPSRSRDYISYDKMMNSAYEAAGIEEIMYPHIVQRVGEEKADVVLADYREVSWRFWKTKILKEIVWDAAGYTMSPTVVGLQLSGRAYESYTGMNYRELLMPAPKLGKLYMDYGCWWFGIAFVCGCLLSIQGVIMRAGKFVRKECFIVGIPALSVIIGYTMTGAGRMDYKNTLIILCGWLLWMVIQGLGALKTEREPNKNVIAEQTGGSQNEKA